MAPSALQPPARVERLSHQVAAQLQRFVSANGIQAGEKLPSERELCTLLGVSRTVVREAVRSLVAKGLLDVRRGGGTTIRAPDPALASELMTLLLGRNSDIAFAHVHEIRRLLEVEIAGIAAIRRDGNDLARIEMQLAVMVPQTVAVEQWAAADVAFHAAIAQATHNPLYPVLLGSIADTLIEVRRTGIRLPQTVEKAYQHHHTIFHTIKAGDGMGARSAMEDHLWEAEDTFHKARLLQAPSSET